MSEFTINEQAFVGYEYKEVEVERDLESVYIDGYRNFGWALEDAVSSKKEHSKAELKFKRDRRIPNKVELTRLQRQFDSCLFEIKGLQLAKTRKAIMVALAIGVVGTICMTLSTFSYLGGHVIMCTILAIPGFLGWIFPYFVHQRITRKKTQEIEPLIDQQYEKIYELCEKAHALLVRA